MNHDVISHQILMGLVSVMLLCVPVILMILMRVVPGQYLHGYEAVYQLEKKQDKAKEEGEVKTSIFSGIKLLVQSPYVLGIFGLGEQGVGHLAHLSGILLGILYGLFLKKNEMVLYICTAHHLLNQKKIQSKVL